jgi:hypothetical protein
MREAEIEPGSPPEEGMAHPTLTDASTFDSVMSFGLIRGGLDLTVLGGLQGTISKMSTSVDANQSRHRNHHVYTSGH